MKKLEFYFVFSSI